MPSAVNGYSLNAPGEPADWSQREFNNLSAFATLLPTSGTLMTSGSNQHKHSTLYVLDDDTYRETILSDVSDHHIEFLTSGSEKLRITSAGYVGIGTESPSYPLDIHIVDNSVSAVPVLRIFHDSSNTLNVSAGFGANILFSLDAFHGISNTAKIGTYWCGISSQMSASLNFNVKNNLSYDSTDSWSPSIWIDMNGKLNIDALSGATSAAIGITSAGQLFRI